jgi:hypothetical protein
MRIKRSMRLYELTRRADCKSKPYKDKEITHPNQDLWKNERQREKPIEKKCREYV